MPWKPLGPDDFPTLGWALLDWWAEFLPSPRSDDEPLLFPDDTARVLLEWYRLDPLTGRRVYRRGFSRRSKGRGKSPTEAAKVIAEVAGPVRFDGWDADGQPVGRPWGTKGDPPAWHQVAAVSEDQTDNTWSVVYSLLRANDGRAADALGLDAGITKLVQRNGKGKAEPVTAAAGSREGQPLTGASLDETHLWTPRNGGTKLAATLRRNVAKLGGTTFETTNSYVPGIGSVAEDSQKAVDKGGRGILVDCVEAPRLVRGVRITEDAADEYLAEALRVAYGDAWWIDIDRIVADIRDPDTGWSEAERFFFNWNSSGADKAVDAKRWDAELLVPGGPPPAGSRIGVGFDGSISGDATVLVGCHEGRSWVIGAWERPIDAPKDWAVPRLAVKAAVRETFETYDVGLMFCDPPKWWTEIDEWAEAFGEERVIKVDTNSVAKFCPLVDRWFTGMREGTHTHSGDDVLRRHVLAVHKRKAKATAADDDGRTMWQLVKGEDGRKIDAAIADVLAFSAEQMAPEIEQEVEELFGSLMA